MAQYSSRSCEKKQFNMYTCPILWLVKFEGLRLNQTRQIELAWYVPLESMVWGGEEELYTDLASTLRSREYFWKALKVENYEVSFASFEFFFSYLLRRH